MTYRSADLGNLDDPLAETVFILLSRQTREALYRSTYSELRRRYKRWLDALSAPDSELEGVLAPCGFQRQRAAQLKALLNAVASANADRRIGPAADPANDLTLDFLRAMSDAQAEGFLTSLPGIGTKSARCVLAYALGRSAFAVDTHVHRIFRRLGLVKSSGRKRDHDPFQAAVPEQMRKRLHVNLVHHGRAVCRSQNARCSECVLVSFCRQGRRQLTGDLRPTAVDLFAGAGGLGLGFRQGGFRVALAVESDRHAAQTYRANHRGVPVIEVTIDASTTAAGLRRCVRGLGHIAVVLAGPPCQGYSAAGKRDPDAGINHLYRHVARLAREFRADAVCLENVPGVRRVNGRGFLDAIVSELDASGYQATPHLIRACEFGVPQHRQRYFLLARRHRVGAEISQPEATHCCRRTGTRARLPQAPTVLNLLKEVPALPAGSRNEPWIDKNGQSYYNIATMAHSDRVTRKIERIKPGEGPISYRRLEREEARTLIAGHRALPVHPQLDRTISVREAALIQGFPVSYVFCGPRAEQPLQVANAVPPAMAQAVARRLFEFVRRVSARTHGRRIS